MLQNADKTVIRRFQSFFITNTALRHSAWRKPKMVRHSRVVASYLFTTTHMPPSDNAPKSAARWLHRVSELILRVLRTAEITAAVVRPAAQLGREIAKPRGPALGGEDRFEVAFLRAAASRAESRQASRA